MAQYGALKKRTLFSEIFMAKIRTTFRIWEIADFIVLATVTSRREQAGEFCAAPLCLALSDVVLSGWTDGK
jgi:hypothetical protein